MEIDSNEQPQKVPVFLRVLSVFSLIFIVPGLLGNVAGLFSGPLAPEDIDTYIANNMDSVNRLYNLGEVYWAETASKILNLIRYTSNNFYMDRIINIGAYSIGLVGILYMLRGRKLGFHLYIIYNLITLVSIYASAPVSAVPPAYVISLGVFSLIFIFLYSINLKFMK